MRYEIKIVEADPFDIMCSDCPVHEIEWWDNVSLEELRMLHKEQMELDEQMKDQADWELTPQDFDTWLHQSIKDGFIRIAA